MKSEITLKQAIHHKYGNNLTPINDISSEWSLFRPYELDSTKKVIYLKIEDLPSHYHTSIEIRECAKNKYGNLLHDISITLIERCFQSTLYLLQANENIISLRGFIQFKIDCLETIEKDFILRFLEFIQMVRKKKFSSSLAFNIDSIGFDLKGNFKLTDFSLFFQSQSLSKPSNLPYELRKIISALILLEDRLLSEDQLLEKVHVMYGSKIQNLVKLALAEDYDGPLFHKLFVQARSIIDIDAKTTLTDSFYDKIQKMDFNDDAEGVDGSMIQTILSESPSKIKMLEKFKPFKIVVIILILLILLAIMSFLVLQLFHTPDFTCIRGKFYDRSERRCLDCAMGCVKCQSNLQNKCYECVRSMYKVLKDLRDEMGECSYECKGTLIKANTCFDPQV